MEKLQVHDPRAGRFQEQVLWPERVDAFGRTVTQLAGELVGGALPGQKA